MNSSSPPSGTAPVVPLSRISERLVVDAIARASLTNRPSSIKYPPDFFAGPHHSSSSSEEEKNDKSKSKKTAQKS